MKLKYRADEDIDEDETSGTLPPKALSVRVIQVAKNPSFVYADLDGNRIAVAVPQKISGKLAGKFINVIANDGADETTYTYQR